MICLSLLLLLPAFHDGDSWSDQAAQLLDQGNIGAAVEILQRHTGEVPDDALGWRLLARAYLGVADEWAASGGDVDLPLTDAKNAAQRAIELQPFDTLVLATQFDVATRLADHRTAAAVALQALGEAVLRDGAVPPEWIARAARARIARFRAAPPADQDAYAAAFAELYRLSESAVRQAASDVELRVLVADFLVTEGLPAVAEADIADALRGDPENAALHQKLIDIDFHQGVAERLAPIYERLAEAVPAGPVFRLVPRIRAAAQGRYGTARTAPVRRARELPRVRALDAGVGGDGERLRRWLAPHRHAGEPRPRRVRPRRWRPRRRHHHLARAARPQCRSAPRARWPADHARRRARPAGIGARAAGRFRCRRGGRAARGRGGGDRRAVVEQPRLLPARARHAGEPDRVRG
ncbi:MAG: hypothetical protein U1E76_03960 [Planctomycetota bacterium]